MPEYGRGIQEMVRHALTIQDRAERQRCAETIVAIMGNMFPHLRDVPDFKHKFMGPSRHYGRTISWTLISRMKSPRNRS